MSGTPMFCGTELAGRIEAAERDFMVSATGAARDRTGSGAAFVHRIAGGAACYAEEGSPFNKVVGIGFGETLSMGELEQMEAAYAAVGAAVQFEVSNLGDPDVAVMLTGRGYRLVSFENVLGRPVSDDRRPMPSGVEVRRSTGDEFDAWVDVIVEGFAHPDEEGVPSHEEFPRDIIANAERDVSAAGATRYIAHRDGVVAGAGGLRIAGSVAQLTGAATAPAHRRRGVQTALLGVRLADAAAAGCEIAVVTTQPGSKSQENVQRRGFSLLYTRAVLVKAPVADAV